MTPQQTQCYNEGRKARSEGKAKDACPYETISSRRSAWLAGWHDEDMKSG